MCLLFVAFHTLAVDSAITGKSLTLPLFSHVEIPWHLRFFCATTSPPPEVAGKTFGLQKSAVTKKSAEFLGEVFGDEEHDHPNKIQVSEVSANSLETWWNNIHLQKNPGPFCEYHKIFPIFHEHVRRWPESMSDSYFLRIWCIFGNATKSVG